MRQTTFPEGWTGEINREGYLDWNPQTGQHDIPMPGVSVIFWDPSGHEYMTWIFDPGEDARAWRAAHRMAHQHAAKDRATISI